MTAQVYIVLNSAKNALLVPSSALSSKQFSGQRKGQSADKAASTQMQNANIKVTVPV
jgi:macrolide-specific efflux system membrane fusion protein